MGIIWSRFRKKESTKQKLQKIQEEISSLEKFGEHTEQRRKKLVGSFIAYSIVFYLIAAIICYFYYLPPTLEERLLYATPFALFIVLIYLIKKVLTCYYRWKVRRNENKLTELREKKVTILDQVMETETYKVAKDILELYAPEQIRKATMLQTIKSPIATPVIVNPRMPIPQSGDVRRRIISPQLSQSFAERPAANSAARPGGPSSLFSFGRHTMTPRPQQIRPSSDGNTLPPPNNTTGGEPPGPPMPRPVLPRERGILDRFVEYLVGDGPSNRYALVCRQCESHNGMALKDEFQYIAFRCAYCFYWNPARKQKPAPPRLETIQPRASVDLSSRVLQNEEESSSDEGETDTDSSTTSSPSSDDREGGKLEDGCTNRQTLLDGAEGVEEQKLSSDSLESEEKNTEKLEKNQESQVLEKSMPLSEDGSSTVVPKVDSESMVKEGESLESTKGSE